MRRTCAALCALFAVTAWAETPQYTLNPSGPLLLSEGGRYGVKQDAGEVAVIDGLAEGADEVVARVVPSASGSGEATQAISMSLRSLTLRVQDDTGQEAVAEVVPLQNGALGFALTSTGPAGVTLTLPQSGTAGAEQGLPTLMDAAGRVFCFVGADDGAATDTTLTRRFAAAVTNGGIALGVAQTAQEACAQAKDVTVPAADWGTAAVAAVDEEVAAWTPVHAPDAARTALNQNAIVQLLANETSAGFVANKSHRNLHWLWDSAFQAWALSERNGARAQKALDVHLRSQITQAADADVGLLYARVDEDAKSPPLGAPAEEEFTQLSPLGLPLRAMQDHRQVPDAVSADALRPWFKAGVAYVDWYAARRDRDQDLRYELNGALEHPDPSSARFTDFWSEFGEVQLPLRDASPRPSLNAVDVNAWVGHLAIELSRLGRELGEADATRMRERGIGVAGRMEEESEGAWEAKTSGWFDFIRVGDQKQRDFGSLVRTPAVWSPLAAAMARTPEHIRAAVEAHALDPLLRASGGVLNRPNGAITVADTWLTVVGLFRYGYDAEARELNAALVSTLSAHPNLHDTYSANGAALGPGGSGVAASVALLALRDRYQEETFDVEAGAFAKHREGRVRRMFRLSDGALAMEVRVEGSDELPFTRWASERQILSVDPTTMTFEDLDGLIGDRVIHVSLPIVEEAQVVLRPAGGGSEKKTLKGPDATLDVHAGDTVELTITRFAGERSGCGCTSGGGTEALLLLGVMALLFLLRSPVR